MDSVTNTVLVRNEAKELEDAIAIKMAGVTVDYENKSCGSILLLVANGGSAAKKLSIEKGNSLQGVEDLEVSVTNGTTVGIVVESGKFINVSGEKKGKVVLKSEDNTSLKVQVVELP